ncbi:cytochrome P460 family protein [Paenibacillus sophorae]|uniref:Cytochrome P460 family protein n=2 Tax=Paenibacillus sophorae TaxID=1333845 RepID=A0ABX8H5K0_9BACL|nr:cytochrome P460 family protein [Paenibacillus sophorae]QWU13127.1 cytochrome P460 family protein [Paenibacillus sophorae]
MLKKQLALTALLALTLTACSNNNNMSMNNMSQQGEQSSETGSNNMSQQEESAPGAESGEYAEIGSGANLIKFPDLEDAIVFTTYDRGDIHENIYVNSREAIEAVQNGEELPSGTVITLEGYKDGELEQYLVMEKRTGWGSQYSPEERNGEWEFQHFTPAREVADDDIGRCFACHANQERDQYSFSLDDMKEFDLGSVPQSNSSSTEAPIAAIPTEDWEVTEIPAHANLSKVVANEASRSIGEEEKAGLLQDVLLTMYLNQYEN